MEDHINLPADKIDIECAEALIRLGYPKVEPVLTQLLEWMQDFNWPVAQTLRPFLAEIGAPLAPYVRTIYETDDGLWKYWVTICIVAESQDLTLELTPELERMATSPTQDECKHKVDVLSRNILVRLKNGTNESVLPKASP